MKRVIPKEADLQRILKTAFMKFLLMSIKTQMKHRMRYLSSFQMIKICLW